MRAVGWLERRGEGGKAHRNKDERDKGGKIHDCLLYHTIPYHTIYIRPYS